MSHVHLATARRSKNEGLRAVTEQRVSALMTAEIGRCEAEWRRTVSSMKDMLAELKAACDAVAGTPQYQPSGSAVGELVQTVVAVAAADAQEALRQVQAEARAEVAAAQSFADRLQAELREQDEDLRSARERLESEQVNRTRAEAAAEAADARAQTVLAQSCADAAGFEARLEHLEVELRTAQERVRTGNAQAADERAARVRAEAVVENARQAHDDEVAALRAQLDEQAADVRARQLEVCTLRDQIAHAQEERANLLATLETVLRSVQHAVSAIVPPLPSSSSPGTGESRSGDRPAAAHPALLPEPTGTNASTTRPSPSTLPSGQPEGSQTASDHMGSTGQAPATPREYASHLLDEAESMYWADLESGQPPLEVVSRLSATLRRAHQQLAARCESTSGETKIVFEELLVRLLDKNATTSFGRHLSIAAYELFS